MQTKKIRKLYRNFKWLKFAESVKEKDNYECQHCFRTSKEVILQAHHKVYHKEKKPWEYFLTDCTTLCKGCHAREHNLIEPNYGWTLLSIDDLGALDGICERENCNTAIRYEHIAYHPQWGYKTVGSSCIQFLTEEDKFKSHQYLKLYKKISKALNKFNWEKGKTKKERIFIATKYRKYTIRIYEDNSSYQFTLKNFPLDKPYQVFKRKISNLEFIKELALITLMGLIARELDKEDEVKALENIFRNIRRSMISMLNKEITYLNTVNKV